MLTRKTPTPSQHYKFALSTLVEDMGFEHVIVLEDDLVVADDVLDFFEAAAKLMQEVPIAIVAVILLLDGLFPHINIIGIVDRPYHHFHYHQYSLPPLSLHAITLATIYTNAVMTIYHQRCHDHLSPPLSLPPLLLPPITTTFTTTCHLPSLPRPPPLPPPLP